MVPKLPGEGERREMSDESSGGFRLAYTVIDRKTPPSCGHFLG